jgi:hypothetical protein
MPAGLRLALAATDLIFLAYWLASALHALGLLNIPVAWLYVGAGERRVEAWNWSFFPLDMAFSVTGLAAVRLARTGKPIWRPLALVSLVLTMVAGGMAVGYWTLLGEFDPAWFLPNLLLLIWPLVFLPRLIGELGKPANL